MAVRLRLAAALSLLVLPMSQALSPATPPERIVGMQLTAPQHGNPARVFVYAADKSMGYQGFEAMLARGRYRHLIQHDRAEILVTWQSSQQWRGLVRVQPRRERRHAEHDDYWWTLSRCWKGPFAGCYLVDEVIPAP